MDLNQASCRRYWVLAGLLFFALIPFGCQSTQKLSDPTLQATLWVQHAAEFDALTLETYQTAQRRLPELLSDSTFTAAVEQDGPVSELPAAIILDVDETVLDNSPYQARLIQKNQSYSSESWNAWAREADADAIEGALALTNFAADHGATVFYVTNRSSKIEDATRRNLENAGFPMKAGTDVLLTKGEREGWSSDKTSRREYIARNYRIVMLFGDNLGDFLNVDGLTEKQRDELIRRYRDRWGSSWFMLPNPVYGSWESAMKQGLPEGASSKDALNTQ